VLFLFGAPAHQDIWDLKPEAPSSVRGEFKPISTRVPGVFVGQHIPRLAQLADRYTIIRSVTHPDNTHTVAMHYMLTGVRHARPETNPENAPDDFPCFGAVVNYSAQTDASFSRGRRPAGAKRGHVPAAVSLNAPANQVSANNHVFPGFFAGFLGAAYDPYFVPQNANARDFAPMPAARQPDRLAAKQRLRMEVDRALRRIDGLASSRSMDAHYQRAFELLTSSNARTAFDLAQEPIGQREKYGDTPFGQGCLIARRLVEAGVRLVTVNWERDDAYWDTHKDNFVDLRTKLLPNFDRGLSTLLEDLGDRGLLDETLVVCLGEFGRTPQINANAGRDHWAPCNSILLAGAGVPSGCVFGASDRLAAYPARDPVTPEDIAATIYHLLGIDSSRRLPDPQSRRPPISTGNVITSLCAG
jgi:hypothetical protein